MRDTLTKFFIGCIIGAAILSCVYLLVQMAAIFFPTFAY